MDQTNVLVAAREWATAVLSDVQRSHLVTYLLELVKTMNWCRTFCIVFAALVVIGALKSWLFGKILRAQPHTRQCPPQKIHPCMQLSAVKLSKALEKGTYTSLFVTNCYIQHIESVNPFINAVIFELFDEARVQAVDADKRWAAWRKAPNQSPKPHWLNGVPITIKEQFQVKGCPNTSGHPRRRHIYATHDSPLVAKLRAVGCVFLGITNISELCMWMESNNKVYGITCNPYDSSRLVGGSSGGEGAAVAACLSTFGLGSDVGGSIRMPAFFNGVYGYKPSAHRITNRGQHPGARGKINHLLGTGPLCRFVEDVLPITRVLEEVGFLEDPKLYAPPKALKEKLPDVRGGSGTKRLRVYAITDFGLFNIKVAQAEQDAVLRVAYHLRDQHNADVTVLNFRDPSQNYPIGSATQVPLGWELFTQILPMWSAHMTSDKTERTFSQYMSEGNPDGMIKPYSEFIKWIFGRSIHTGMSIGLCLIERTEELFAPDSLKINNFLRGQEFREALNRELGDDAVIICPTYPMPAPKHHDPTWYPFQWQYTAAFNLGSNPAINCPIWNDEPAGAPIAPSYASARKSNKPNDYHVPKGVQVVGAWGNDMLPLAVASLLEADQVCGYRLPSWAMPS